MTEYDAARDTCAITHAFTTLTRAVAADHTKWNIVFDLAGREFWYRSAASPAVKHVALDAFDFSCAAPLLMLDVNADLAGDVAHAFTPYDRDVNAAVFTAFCRRWGIRISPEGTSFLMDFFDAYECGP